LPAPWRRLNPEAPKNHAVYVHPNGWRIEHCGHPTALWPYALYTPAGQLITAANGRAFRTSALAAAEVLQRTSRPEPRQCGRCGCDLRQCVCG